MTSKTNAKVRLIVQFSAQRSGSALSSLQITDGLLAKSWQTHVVFGKEGPMIVEYQKAGHIAAVAPHRNWLRHHGLLDFFKSFMAEHAVIFGVSGTLRRVKGHEFFLEAAVLQVLESTLAKGKL